MRSRCMHEVNVPGMRDLRLFRRALVNSSSFLVSSDGQAFASQGAVAFEHAFGKQARTFQVGNQDIDMDAVPKLSDWFGEETDEEAADDGERAAHTTQRRRTPAELQVRRLPRIGDSCCGSIYVNLRRNIFHENSWCGRHV